MITNSKIAIGDSLGAQLTSLASLIYVSLINNQRIVFWEELRYYRRGMQFLDVFDIDDIDIICRSNRLFKLIFDKYGLKYKKIDTWEKKMKRIYKSKIAFIVDTSVYKLIKHKYNDFSTIDAIENGLHTNQCLLNLNDKENYDILSGFGVYRDWENKSEEIISKLHFKTDIINEGENIINILPNDKKRVSLHFRLTDYLVLSSLNLTQDYYKKAMSYFDTTQYRFYIFSDDINQCKEFKFLNEYDVFFMEPRDPALDMYLMSRCDGNIIANSSFSLWGALLNNNHNKTVICPHNYIGDSAKQYQYINGNYYPKNWIAI